MSDWLRAVAAVAVDAPPDVDWPDFDPGPGPQWSAFLPDGILADTLERQCGEGSQWERLERIGAWERVVAWAQAHQLREMAVFAHAAEQDAVRHTKQPRPRVSGPALDVPVLAFFGGKDVQVTPAQSEPVLR